MQINRFNSAFSFVGFWVVSVVLLNVIAYQINQQMLNEKISAALTSYLLISLEEPMFSNLEGRVSDRNAIEYIAKTINENILDFTSHDWLSAAKTCDAVVSKIDNVSIDSNFNATQNISLIIPRNKINRIIDVGVNCEHQVSPYIFWSLSLSFIFFALHHYLPSPLSGAQHDWKKFLLAKGYDEVKANDFCKSATSRALLTESQLRCYEQLHSVQKQNHLDALRFAEDPRVAGLTQAQLVWFIWALNENDFEHAIALALSPDVVEINLIDGSLTIHGASINVKKTPLFYYVWYANKRLQDDGWIVNPRSNKPDHEAITELVGLMHQFSGHAKAIADLENGGLKARTLDQNRSKIKDEIIAVIGEALAGPYLFEAKKDSETQRMSYRLILAKEKIKIIS